MSGRGALLKRAGIFLFVSAKHAFCLDRGLWADTMVGLLCMLLVHGMQLGALSALLFQLQPGAFLPYLGQQGALLIAWGTLGFFFDGLRLLPRSIELGNFESSLGTPLPCLLVAAASNSSPVSLVDILLGIILIAGVSVRDLSMGVLAGCSVPMTFLALCSLFILGSAAALRLTRGGVGVSDFLIFTTFTLSSLPSGAGFTGKARLLLYLCPALFTALLPIKALSEGVVSWIFLGTLGATVLFLASLRIFSWALQGAQFASVSRMRGR